MVELSYKEKNGLLYPLLETGSMMEETESMSLGRYGKLAEDYLKVKDKSRYSLLLRTGKLQETLKQIEEEAWDLHDQIVESYVKMKAADRKINPSDTMEMTRLRNEAAMIAQETVIQEVICKPR